MNLPPPRPGQKYNSPLVLQYLLKNADDENAVTMNDILSHLSKYGIESDRRSVYRDIHDLVELLNAELQEEDRIPERERLGYEVVFTRKLTKNSPQGGYLVTQRPYEFDELRLLTECVNLSKSHSFPPFPTSILPPFPKNNMLAAYLDNKIFSTAPSSTP